MTEENTMKERTYTVTGMTCGHCVASVTEEVGDLAGVESVDVDLGSGRMVVTSHGVSDYAVLAAVTEAGYTAAAA
ncbi:hypothetical protein BH20ACT5_BH20ACT5_21580 [soil metagenome]